MSPLINEHKAKTCKDEASIEKRFSLHLPYEAQVTEELALVVNGWSSLPEMIRAGIVALVKAGLQGTGE